MAGLMASGMTGIVLAQTPVVSHDDSFSKEGLFKADVSTLKDTQLVLHPDVPLVPDKNVLWCGTMQLAWNKAIDLVGEKLHFTTPSPEADLLNRKDFTDADLDPASYVALADFERNNVEDEIRAALEKTFQGAASPELIPEKPASPGPDDFAAYAYLYKNLVFAYPFKEAPREAFESQTVTAFGFGPDDKELSSAVFQQVTICDYNSENDFVINLKIKSTNDELILAKISPGSTLQSTINRVLDRVENSSPVNVDRNLDYLWIPKINFDLRRDATELEGLRLQPGSNTHIKSGLTLARIRQLVRFQLNENGAILKSEAIVLAELGSSGDPEPVTHPHILIFDRPFLILMKQNPQSYLKPWTWGTSRKPYFALWVGNASLLVPATNP